MALWKWSKTAGSNANADATINWAEGQAPSSVNDSARAMMARTAEWRDDISGTIATVGTAANYQVTSNQGFDNLADMNGAMIAFVPHITNVATCTLNVDSLGFKPLRFGPGLELQSGVLIQGTPYVASYNNADGVWYLQGGFSNPYGVPLGGMMPYTGSTAPNSAFVLPSGQAISRTAYATYFALVGTTYGSGDGSTTFNVLDLRGRFIAGLDNMNGSAASRITVAGGNFDGTVLGGTGGAQNHTLVTGELPPHNHGVTDPGHTHGVSDPGHNHGHSDPTHTHTVNDPGHAHNLIGGTAAGFSNPTVVEGNGSAASLTAGAQAATSGITLSAAATGVTNVAALTGISNQANFTGISTTNAGSGAAHTILPPAIMLPYILRII